MKALLAALWASSRTSEFWLVVFQIVAEAFSAPVPDEWKVVAWLYIAFRILSKVAQFVIKNPKPPEGVTAGAMKWDSAIVVGALLLATPAIAQEAVPLDAISERGHVTLNSGYMVLTNGEDWSGVSVGGTVLYNLHPRFSVFGGYDHGFPVNDVDPDIDLFRVMGSLKVHPNAFIGLGYGWFDQRIEGAIAHLLISKQVMPRLAVAGMYAHVLANDELEDFEYARVFVNYHIFGRE